MARVGVSASVSVSDGGSTTGCVDESSMAACRTRDTDSRFSLRPTDLRICTAG